MEPVLDGPGGAVDFCGDRPDGAAGVVGVLYGYAHFAVSIGNALGGGVKPAAVYGRDSRGLPVRSGRI